MMMMEAAEALCMATARRNNKRDPTQGDDWGWWVGA